ncbi:MAG: cation-translocating P-type ATPase [Ruminococcaceae bacterium]|nr:cation-translocating P-type ATPase [Oscillospiraceae bacterium]
MKHYSEKIEAVFQNLKSQASGLSSQEAKERLLENGANKLADPPKVPLWKKFLMQFADPMIIVLLAAALISFIMAIVEGESLADVFIILFVVVLNAVLGVIQENKAEKAIDALKAMTKAKCKVLRDGQVCILNSEDLVVGDVILLEAGDAVPADARLFDAASLKAEESALTGESVPTDKFAETIELKGDDIPLGDRSNMVYTGTTIVYGRGKAVVVATGMDTEMGKIAQAITDASDEKTPLQVKLAQLSKILTVAVLAICVFIFAVNMIRGGEILDTFMVAVSLAVAAIPEGLSAVVTIVLSMGVSKMAAQNAIIRRLTAVETLGCTQIICSDKTGTLTQNKMTVVEHFTGNLDLLCYCNALCNDAEIDSDGNVTGEPTEAALQQFAFENGIDRRKVGAEQARIAEAPFDSSRKMMSTLHFIGENKVMQYTKGAPDVILSRCNRYISPVDGKTKELTDDVRQAILAHNKAMADKALRVLAAAFTVYPEVPSFKSPEEIEKDLVFIGLSGMIDPVRPEVIDAVEKCRRAGVRPVMITGDHIDTAVAIGKQLGIITDASQAMTGADLDKYTDEELESVIVNFSVYARVQPEHKVRIVNAWKKLIKITAMTGDGVNDAPSIKTADIGIGMGITGTDVTKGVADMILSDDNFATIVNAVEEGRRIYANVRKTIQFLLSSNLSEVLSVFIASLFGLTVFKPIHILWINLITDSLPALGLGMEDAEGDVMSQPPRDSNEGIFANGLGIDVIWQGACISALTLISFFIGKAIDGAGFGTTMAFVTMSMAEIVHSFNMRSREKSVFKLNGHNKFLWGTMAASFVLTAAVIFVPFLRTIFSFENITIWEYILALVLGALILPISEAVKYLKAKNK